MGEAQGEISTLHPWCGPSLETHTAIRLAINFTCQGRKEVKFPSQDGLVWSLPPAFEGKRGPKEGSAVKERSQEEHQQDPLPFIQCLPPTPHQELEGDFSKPRRALEAERGTRFEDSGPSGDGRARFQSQHPVQITG